jgi:hypothetical protein
LLVWASTGRIARGLQRHALVAMLAMAVVYGIFRAASGLAAGFGEGVSRYFFKQLIVEPFAALGEPWSAAWMQSHPLAACLRAGIIVALLTAAFWSRRRGDPAFRRASACGAWVVISVLPVFSFFHVSATLEGSRYLYLPAAGFVLLVTGLAADVFERSPTRSAVTVGLMLVILAVPAVAALQNEQQRWTAAAQLRDQVLASFVELIPGSQCVSIAAEGTASHKPSARARALSSAAVGNRIDVASVGLVT